MKEDSLPPTLFFKTISLLERPYNSSEKGVKQLFVHENRDESFFETTIDHEPPWLAIRSLMRTHGRRRSASFGRWWISNPAWCRPRCWGHTPMLASGGYSRISQQSLEGHLLGSGILQQKGGMSWKTTHDDARRATIFHDHPRTTDMDMVSHGASFWNYTIISRAVFFWVLSFGDIPNMKESPLGTRDYACKCDCNMFVLWVSWFQQWLQA